MLAKTGESAQNGTVSKCASRVRGRWQCEFVIIIVAITIIHGCMDQAAHSRSTSATKFALFWKKTEVANNQTKCKISGEKTWMDCWWAGWTVSKRLILEPDDRLAVNLLASSRSIWRGRLLGSRKTTARMTPCTWSSGQEPVRIRCGRPRPFGRNSRPTIKFLN